MVRQLKMGKVLVSPADHMLKRFSEKDIQKIMWEIYGDYSIKNLRILEEKYDIKIMLEFFLPSYLNNNMEKLHYVTVEGSWPETENEDYFLPSGIYSQDREDRAIWPPEDLVIDFFARFEALSMEQDFKTGVLDITFLDRDDIRIDFNSSPIRLAEKLENIEPPRHQGDKNMMTATSGD